MGVSTIQCPCACEWQSAPPPADSSAVLVPITNARTSFTMKADLAGETRGCGPSTSDMLRGAGGGEREEAGVSEAGDVVAGRTWTSQGGGCVGERICRRRGWSRGPARARLGEGGSVDALASSAGRGRRTHVSGWGGYDVMKRCTSFHMSMNFKFKLNLKLSGESDGVHHPTHSIRPKWPPPSQTRSS
jgi:hypothetical protein